MFLNVFKLSVRNYNFIHMLNKETKLIEKINTNFTRSYKRERIVSKIVNEDELYDDDDQLELSHAVPKIEKKSTKRKSKETKKDANPLRTDLNDEKSEKKEKKVTDWGSLPVFKKIYDNEEAISSMMLSIVSKKQKKKKDIIILEGLRLINEALDAGLEIRTLLFSKSEDAKRIDAAKLGDAKLYKVPYRTIQLWSTLETCPGITAIFKRPEKAVDSSPDALPITIICDNVRDPGNMGSMLRAAAGIGCEKIILSKGCVDIWESKVLRASMGAHFKIPISTSQTWDEINERISESSSVFIADNQSKRYINDFETDKDYERELEEVAKEMPDSFGNIEVEKEKKMYDKKEKKENMLHLPLIPYYNAKFSKNEIVLIVGGETQGLSEECFKFAESRNSVRVNIPLNNKMESLNTGMALGIIGFEAKRQFLKDAILSETKPDSKLLTNEKNNNDLSAVSKTEENNFSINNKESDVSVLCAEKENNNFSFDEQLDENKLLINNKEK